MTIPSDIARLNGEARPWNLTDLRFLAEAAEREPFLARDSWAFEGEWPSAFVGAAAGYFTPNHDERLARLQFGLAHVVLADGYCIANVAAGSSVHARDGIALLKKMFPPMEIGESQRVPVTFWAHTGTGPLQISRRIDVPRWEQIRANYPTITRKALEALVFGWRPEGGGQLLLWQGPPGVGKTWALRALAWEWRDWCKLEYVADPDKLFGEHASYLIQVLLEGAHDENQKWRVLVLEDAGELLAPDARQQAGQGLGRFLNTVDGLIGQGLRVLVLVTTNEELGRLHPAVQRPGRCASRVAFQTFSPAASAVWCQDHGLSIEAEDLESHHTLADLYDTLREGSVRINDNERPVGFHPDRSESVR